MGAVERIVAGGTRHWVLMHLDMVAVKLVIGGKDLIAGAAGEVDQPSLAS